MSVLKGRPERPAPAAPEAGNVRRRELMADHDIVKVTTRMTVRLARDMKVAAAQQNISIEQAYTDAIEAYLRGRR